MKINLNVYCFILLFVFSSFFSLNAQSKFEFGLGILINHSKINEEVFVPLAPVTGSYKVRRQLALTTRLGYKYSERFHLNSGVGFSWLGAFKKDLSEQIVTSTIEAPLQIEWNVRPYLHLSSGVNYNYVYGFSSTVNESNSDLLPLIHSRHQFGLRHGIAISHEQIEFSLSYSHYFTDLFRSSVMDENGNQIGSLVWTLSNIQLGIIFRG